MVSIFEEKVKEVDNYVELTDLKGIPLRQRVELFLKDKTQKICLLLGDSASGKTNFCYKLKLDMLLSNHEFLPIYINPNEYNLTTNTTLSTC